MRRQDRTAINAAARKATGTHFTICCVGLNIANPGKGDPDVSRPDMELTWNHDDSRDLYDNGTMLAHFKLPSPDWSGTLDIWVYTYETIADLRDGATELQCNLYALFRDGICMDARPE